MLPGVEGEVRLSVGDVTGGKVKVSVTTADGEALVEAAAQAVIAAPWPDPAEAGAGERGVGPRRDVQGGPDVSPVRREHAGAERGCGREKPGRRLPSSKG